MHKQGVFACTIASPLEKCQISSAISIKSRKYVWAVIPLPLASPLLPNSLLELLCIMIRCMSQSLSTFFACSREWSFYTSISRSQLQQSRLENPCKPHPSSRPVFEARDTVTYMNKDPQALLIIDDPQPALYTQLLLSSEV